MSINICAHMLRLRRPVPRANVGESRALVTVPGTILEINDVRSSLTRGSQCRHSERMHRDRWVEYTAAGVAFDEVFDSPHRKRSSSKAVVAFSPCGEGRAKEGTTTLNSFSPYFVCSTPVYRFSHGDRGLKRVVNGVGKWLTCESCGYVGGCRCLKSFSGSSQPIRSTANQCCIIRSRTSNESAPETDVNSQHATNNNAEGQITTPNGLRTHKLERSIGRRSRRVYSEFSK